MSPDALSDRGSQGINPATLSGAIDIIVVRQKDGFAPLILNDVSWQISRNGDFIVVMDNIVGVKKINLYNMLQQSI